LFLFLITSRLGTFSTLPDLCLNGFPLSGDAFLERENDLTESPLPSPGDVPKLRRAFYDFFDFLLGGPRTIALDFGRGALGCTSVGTA